MKRTATAVDQPGKTETTQPPAQRHNAQTKFGKDHKLHDPVHGRVNKYPIWINFGPY